MKIKGITFWEQHLEKLVIAVAALIFVGLAAKQFIGNPNGGEVKGTSLKPGEVDAYFRAKARDLLDQIEQPSTDADAIPPYREQAGELSAALSGAISRAPQLTAQLSYRTRLPGGAGDVMGAGKAFIVPQPQPPVIAARDQYVDALLPEVLEKHAEIKAMFRNSSEPPDLAWTTVRATFDAGDLLRQYRGEQLPPGASDAQPVPEPWYNGKIAMLDVVMERVEVVNGREINSTTIHPLPGQLTFRERISGNIVAADRDAMLREIDDPARQAEIIRPEFYPTKSEVWQPPQTRGDAPAEGAAVEQAPEDRLQDQIGDIEKDLQRLKDKLEELGGPVQEEPGDEPDEPGAPGPGGGGGRGGGGGPPGGGLGAGSGGGRGKNTGQDPDKDKPGSISARKGLMKKIAQKEQQLAKLKADLEALAGAANAGAADAAPEAVVEQGVIDIWAHDISVEAGKTYRYRLTMHVYNPFFGRKLSLVEEQRDLADRFTLASAASEWSAPITVTERLRIFITRGESPDENRRVGQSPLGRVSAEVFRFYDGRWRVENFNVAPGDRVGETRQHTDGEQKLAIDYATDWFVLDVIRDIDASDADRDRGRDGLVLLQSLSTGDIDERDPRRDASAADRVWLLKQVELTEVAVARVP